MYMYMVCKCYLCTQSFYILFISLQNRSVCVNGVLVEGVQLIPTLHMSLPTFVCERTLESVPTQYSHPIVPTTLHFIQP